ncbi:MAG: permease [Gemmatimonadetes bacterium]|nr:MAG: permease [Gemmatimonadota bacterium]
MNWVLVSVIGLVAGVVAGVFGVGGAIVIVPGLVLLMGLPQHTANGTSLAALLLPVGLLGTLEYYKRGQVNLAYAAVLAAGLFFGALAGAKLAGMLADATLRKAFAVFLILVAARLLLR